MNDITLTYQGIFKNPDRDEFNKLDLLMRKYQSAKRFSRERIFDGLSREETTKKTRELFHPNLRYMRDAFVEAEANISSQKELLPTCVVQHKQNITNLKERINKTNKSKRTNKKEIIDHLRSRINKHQKKVNYYQHHIDNGTVPKTVDGSRRNLRLLNKGEISKEEWRDLRTNSITSRGDASKKGNLNIRLSHIKNNVFGIGIIDPFGSKRGQRIHFNVEFPTKFAEYIKDYLETEKAYFIRIIRKDGVYEVHLSITSEVETKSKKRTFMAGLDINPDNLSVSIVYPNGNFRTSKVFWMHDVNTVSTNKRKHIIYQTVIEVTDWLKENNVDQLTIEKLKFNQQNKSRRFNRMSNNFSYRSIIEAIKSTCFKKEITLREVGAYYSSFIGMIKYQRMFGLSIHQSAALVLARRGLGLNENIPKQLMSVLFAKEAEKGQKVNGLFTHWEKASNWYKEKIKSRYKLSPFVRKPSHWTDLLEDAFSF